MLSFLLLASTSGQPLPSEAVARCSGLPADLLPFHPSAATTWRSKDGHVVLAAWGDDPGAWHVGEHGVTFATSAPWPLAARFTAPSGLAFELTDRLGPDPAVEVVDGLMGTTTIVRVTGDGAGVVAAPVAGGGRIHVADGDGLLAISDRAGLAAGGTGAAVRRTDLPDLLRGVLVGERTGYRGVRGLRPGSHVELRGREGPQVVQRPTPWAREPEGGLDELARLAADDLAELVGQAAEAEGPRTLVLGAGPGSLVLAASAAAAGVGARFTVQPAGDGPDATAAAKLAGALGAQLTPLPEQRNGGSAIDDRVRRAVRRVEAGVAPDVLRPSATDVVAADGGLVVTSVGGGGLTSTPGPSGRRLLRSQAWATLDAEDRAWEVGRGQSNLPDRARGVLAELDRRRGRRVAATAELIAPAVLLDPTALPSVARLSLAAAIADADPAAVLVEALHPPMSSARTQGGGERRAPTESEWRALAPVLEAHVLGHARSAVDEVVDIDEVSMVVRAGSRPDVDTTESLQGLLALAVWAAGTDVHDPVRSRSIDLRSDVAAPAKPPTLITGITSRSLLHLSELPVPLAAVEIDALLGIEVDREVRDLATQVLLAAGATPGHLPADLDDRLSGSATAHLAPAAKGLLARRGGILADPRLALTLPFWRAHVGPPRCVLVAERPPDLALRSPALVPVTELLGWWVDAVTCAASSGVDLRIVDPGDLVDTQEVEATGWDGLDGESPSSDLVRVVRTVDSLVREVELEAARPLLRTVRRARAVAPSSTPQRPAPAAAPLHVVDELWERAVEADRKIRAQAAEADDLQARLEELESELSDLRGRKGLKAAWATLLGRES